MVGVEEWGGDRGYVGVGYECIVDLVDGYLVVCCGYGDDDLDWVVEVLIEVVGEQVVCFVLCRCFGGVVVVGGVDVHVECWCGDGAQRYEVEYGVVDWVLVYVIGLVI